MKLRILTASFCILPLMCAAQQPIPHPQEHPKLMHGQGCVEAGVENNCLLAHDLKSGKLYNLLIKGIAPPLGVGIDFTGHPHKGPSTCMQGIAIDVESWTRNHTIKCPRHPQRKE
ncbi:MAG: hypothetical protein KGN79_03825 [Acidobacteriota bacterium]|nr:hypothetical protein [Acidobacteriota bacterium]